MRQQWLARWEHTGQQHSLIFISLEYEHIARISFQILLMEENEPVPNAFTVEKMGEPFDDRRKPGERTWNTRTIR